MHQEVILRTEYTKVGHLGDRTHQSDSPGWRNTSKWLTCVTEYAKAINVVTRSTLRMLVLLSRWPENYFLFYFSVPWFCLFFEQLSFLLGPLIPVGRCHTRGESEESIGRRAKEPSWLWNPEQMLSEVQKQWYQWPHEKDSCPPKHLARDVVSVKWDTRS